MGSTLSITDCTSFIQHFQKQVISILLILYIAVIITGLGLTYVCPYLHVIKFLVSATPVPALVDAAIAHLYSVAGVNIPTVALRVSLMISSVTVMFTG